MDNLPLFTKILKEEKESFFVPVSAQGFEIFFVTLLIYILRLVTNEIILKILLPYFVHIIPYHDHYFLQN